MDENSVWDNKVGVEVQDNPQVILHRSCIAGNDWVLVPSSQVDPENNLVTALASLRLCISALICPTRHFRAEAQGHGEDSVKVWEGSAGLCMPCHGSGTS